MIKIILSLLIGLLTSVVLAVVHQLVAAVVVAIITVLAVVVLLVLAWRGIRGISAVVRGDRGRGRRIRRRSGRRVR